MAWQKFPLRSLMNSLLLALGVGIGKSSLPGQEVVYDRHSLLVNLSLALNFWSSWRNTLYQTHRISARTYWPMSSRHVLHVYRLLFISVLCFLLITILTFAMFPYYLFALLRRPPCPCNKANKTNKNINEINIPQNIAITSSLGKLLVAGGIKRLSYKSYMFSG